ncbi:hypothetical protein OsJ_22322 [Oryza sativa Japonica Group]|uniref:OSJNBa0060D06.4 protein n=2 Tax=Oryza sativa TaxID=4530 RepID=A3BEI7_ORYSJ|nr:hypothetical protein OsJ_22322 [Oryza sativa Japonica Group]CAE03538.2 OSJNBa0060D06.4 [Oryza sativa Japonica Group]CAE04512.1 OSJNBb0059K02.22 [Oryza sativa Japonica Group]CAJ86329.1 OSIGBa0113E10.12 [Oryza sativa]
MAARGSKKRKLAEEDPGIIGAGRPPSPPSGSRGSADRRLGVVVVADPDSDQGSCDSLLSDATTRLTQDDAAEAASRLLIAVVVRSPEALLAFVQRLTPEAVFRAIDWDLVPSGEARKIAEGRTHWTEEELRVFLQSCLEEIQARNIISSSPEAQGFINLERKMLERAGKIVTKKQVKWRWTWLESKATGFARDPVTQAILAPDKWWESQESERKGAKAFKDAPLKCIDEHHAVFQGRMVVEDHSNVPGAQPVVDQQPAHQPMINVEDIRAPPLPPPSAAARVKGKRPSATESGTSGSSSKSRTCSDSSDEALHRLADDSRVESMESLAEREEEKKVRGLEACMDMVEADGYPPGSELWYMAAQLFRDDACWHQFFLDDRHTAESRLRFIQVHCNWLRRGAAPSATAHRNQPVC